MSKTGLLFTVRMLCVYSLTCCITLGHAPIVYGNPLLKGIRDKASVLELMLRRTPKNQCERYAVNAGKAEKGDFATQFEWLNKYEEQKCSVEDLDATVWGWLGMLYEKGNGTKQDIDKAIYYYTKSAEKGDAAIQYFLGNTLIDHKDDYENGIFWLDKSATSGEADAQFALGVFYNDEGSPHFNVAAAFRYFEMGAKQGDVDCSYELGLIYYYGDRTEISISKAIDLFYYAAERGEEDAAHYVSWLLLHEYKITEDLLEEAYLWLEVSKHFGSRLDEDGELEQRLLSKLPPELKAKVDARLPKVYSEIENKKKGL